MGTDIHCFVEVWADGWSSWQSVAEFHLPRDRDAFGRIAGVHGAETMFPARGLPSGLGYSSDMACHLRVNDDLADHDGWCSRVEAENWVEKGETEWVSPDRILVPGLFAFSWLTLSEWLSAIEMPGHPAVSVEYFAVAGAMTELERSGLLSRVVIWFDH